MMRLPFLVLGAFLIAAPLAADQGNGVAGIDSVPTTRAAKRWGDRGTYLPGTRFRAVTEDRREITGVAVEPYSLSTSYLRLCPADADGCNAADTGRVIVIPTDDLRELSIWGKSAGGRTYAGALLGAGTGMVIAGGDDEDAQIVGFLGGFLLGGFLGHQLDRGKVEWSQVFPCYHACAYPELAVIQ